MTRQPEVASQIASDRARSRRRGRDPARACDLRQQVVFGGRLDTISGLSRRTRAQRSSQERRSNVSFLIARA